MTASDRGFDVFVSYSHRDLQDVRPMAERLQADGLRVWFDEWSVRPSSNLSADINQGLDGAAILIICVSTQSLKSTWRRLETQTFLWRTRRDRKRRIIVLRLDESSIQPSLERFTVIDWRRAVRNQNYQLLLSSCRTTQSE